MFAVTPGIQERFGAGRCPTRRSPSWPSPAPRSEPRSRGCARSSRSCSATHGPIDGLAGQPVGQVLVSVERAAQCAARRPVGRRRGGRRRDPLPDPRHVVPGDRRAQDRRPVLPAEAKGLLKAAIRDDNPVIFLEHKRLYSVEAPAPEPGEVIPLGRGADRRGGRGHHDRLRRQGRARRSRGGRTAGGRSRHRRRGHRPAHAAAARRRHRVESVTRPIGCGGQEEPRSAGGRRGCSAFWRRMGCTTSTTMGSRRRRVSNPGQPAPQDAFILGVHRHCCGCAGAVETGGGGSGELSRATLEVVMPRLSESMEEGTIVAGWAGRRSHRLRASRG